LIENGEWSVLLIWRQIPNTGDYILYIMKFTMILIQNRIDISKDSKIQYFFWSQSRIQHRVCLSKWLHRPKLVAINYNTWERERERERWERERERERERWERGATFIVKETMYMPFTDNPLKELACTVDSSLIFFRYFTHSYFICKIKIFYFQSW